MLNSIKLNIYILTLIFGTILACSSSSWFTCWLGLEINLISLIPLLIIQLNPYSSETAIKYFIAQALASIIIIFSSILFFKLRPNNSIIFTNLIIILALSIKMGAAPFHFWLPQVIQTAKWFQIILILTWQKIAPIILILFVKNNLIKIILLLRCFIGAIGAINQITIKKILVYSSILHTGWILASILCSKYIWIFYFLIYSLITLAIILSLSFSSFKTVKELFHSNTTPLISFFVFLNFLSLAGIPPFLGFIIKLIAISSIFLSGIDFSIFLILIISSLVSLFYYLRLIFSSLILSHKNNKLIINYSFKTFSNIVLLFLSSLILFLFPLIFIIL